jgi:hypothetical protein
MNRNLLSLSSVIVVGLVAGMASADQMCLDYDGYGANRSVGVSYDSSKSWNSATRTSFSTIKVGEHLFHSGPNNVSTFCVQLFEGLIVGEHVCFDIVGVPDVPDAPPQPGPMGAVAATVVNDLYWRFYAYATDESQAAATRNLRCSAFGVALYELTHENFTAITPVGTLAQINLFGGAFQVNGNNAGMADVVSLAQFFLLGLGTDGFHNVPGLLGLTNRDKQDQLVVVPLPAAGGLAMAGLALAGVIRKRLRRA